VTLYLISRAFDIHKIPKTFFISETQTMCDNQIQATFDLAKLQGELFPGISSQEAESHLIPWSRFVEYLQRNLFICDSPEPLREILCTDGENVLPARLKRICDHLGTFATLVASPGSHWTFLELAQLYSKE
jgi:hypothetical protein